MGRHKLPYKMKKPNAHHKYWRYVLSTGPRTEISTRTKIKYEAERIAKQAYWDALEKMNNCPTFGDYAKDFFTDKCRLSARRKSSNKPFTDDMIKLKRSNLSKYLLKEYENTFLTDIKMLQYEDFRSRLNLANSTKNGISVTMKQILNEAVRDEIIDSHQLDKIESLSEVSEKPRDSLSIKEIKKLFPIKYDEALTIWKEPKYYTLMFILVSSGMRSGEVRALKWSDVMWEDSGIIISKAVKHSGEIGTVKEKKEKIVRLPQRALDVLKLWKDVSLANDDDDFIFYGKGIDKPVDKNTIIAHFKKGLANAMLVKVSILFPTPCVIPSTLTC